MCQDSNSGLGTNTAHTQQETILRIMGQEYPNPRKYCLDALQTFIEGERRGGAEIILSLDANSTTQEGANAFTSMIVETVLVDAISHHHGAHLPHTCLRGRRRLDYMLVTPALLPYLRRSGHFGIQDAIPSDHVGCWIEFDGTALFRGATECLSSTLKMPFNLRQMSAVETFISIMEMHFIAQNVEKRIERMQNSFARGEMTEDEYEAEYGNIALDVNDAMFAGIKAASKPNVG